MGAGPDGCPFWLHNALLPNDCLRLSSEIACKFTVVHWLVFGTLMKTNSITRNGYFLQFMVKYTALSIDLAI